MRSYPYQGVIHRYHEYLPVEDKCIVTLQEGNTPLFFASRLREFLRLPCEVWLKFEGLNPTGSFKDRGMTYAVSKALEKGAEAIICASTGNTSASAAAYAAKAGLKCIVLVPGGQIAHGKLSQAMIHGATVVQVKGNFDAALKIVLEAGEKLPVEIVNSVNPFRLQGQKTAAFEVCEFLGRAPTHHFLPVGNAGNITAYWMGYKEWATQHKTSLPQMMGFQAAGAAPLVLGKPVDNPQTVATAIRIGNPASWVGAVKARDESGGIIDKVEDDEIVGAYQLAAKLEGYFCEPASGASIAGLIKMAGKNFFKKGDCVVCTLTGHGLKDPDTAISHSPKPLECGADLKSLMKVLEG